MNLRPRLTYANVVATLALFLAIGGGTVYAASKLKKNSVKSVNIARGAVKSSDLGAGSVNGAKIKNETVTGADVKDQSLTSEDFAAGLFDTDLTGGPSASVPRAVNGATTTPIPLTGATTFTPQADDVTAVGAELQVTQATSNALQPCDPTVRILINGQPRLFLGQGTNSLTPVTQTDADADGPIGLISPGASQTITAVLEGDTDCTAASRLTRLEIRVAQIR